MSVEMDCKSKMRKLRESTGMNRREFCTFFGIPYRTVTDWELDNRHAPEYVLRLLEYYIRHENIRREAERGISSGGPDGKNRDAITSAQEEKE